MDSPSGFFGEEGPFSEELGFLSIFQNLLEGAAFHQMLYDGDGKPIDYQYLGVNRSFETMLGLSAKQVLGKRFSQLFSFFEESPIDWVEKYATVAQGEKAEFESFFSPLKKWFRIRAFSPKKGFFITLFQDITPRKKLEEKLRIREASYQSLFHHIPLGIALATPSGKFLDANTSYARILGFDSPEELISTYTDLHSQLYHDPQVRDILLQQARQNRGFIRSDVSLRRKDGQIIQVDMRLNTILDEGDHIQYVEAIIEDITHKRQLENSLEQTRNRLENILRSMQDGVWSAKLPEMELIYFNNAVEKITGVSREVFLSDSGTWKKVLLPEDTEKIVQQVNLAFQEGSLDLKHRIRTSDGQVRWIHNRVQFHHDESGKPCRADGIISDITTLMEVQHRLQESEERLRTALEGAQEALWEVDWQGRTIEVTPHFWSLLGYPPEPSQPTCMDFPQMERLVHPDDQFSGDFSGESFSAQRGFFLEKEIRFRCHCGKWKWLLMRGTRIGPRPGTAPRLVGTFVDITRMKELDNLLQTLSQAVEQSPTFVVISDPNACVEYVNPKFTSVMGYSLEEIRGKHISDVTRSSRAGEKEKVLQEIQQMGEFHDVFKNLDKNGNTVWVSTSISAIKDKKGKILHFVEVAEDITQRRTVSEQMKHFFALTPELVVLLDLQGTFLDSNPAWEKLLGMEIPSPAFANLQSVCHPEDAPRVEQFLRTLGKGEETKNFELRLRNQKGEYLWVSWSFAHATTDPIVFGVGRDVSAERRLQQNLQQAAQKEREASRLKSEFLANMSHEIRTPLNGVMGMIGLLQETRLDDYQEELLKIGNTSSRQLLDVITDILDLSKIEAGKMDLENRPFSLEELLSEIHTLFDIRASQKDIAFSIATDPSIPAQLIGDVPKIKQVLLNLVSNAVKFTESGTVSLGVQPVSPAEEKTLRLRFSVEDTGKGIPAEKHHLLFQLFSQVDGSITRKVGGSGLGLAICKRLVKIMSGTIGFESQPGIGSTFWMEIPLQYESTGTPREKTPTLPNTSKPREGIRVLLAEDDPLNQKIMKIWIRNCGWHMQLAENGRQALQMADPDKFDVVIMDVQMPEMDGLEATRKIRQRESFQGTQRLPIIALTAHAFREDQQKCLEAGMDDYTSKPVQPEELKRKICNLLVSRDPGKEP